MGRVLAPVLSDWYAQLHRSQGVRLAVDSVNASRDHLQARKLLDAGLSPTVAQVADAGFDLGTLLAT